MFRSELLDFDLEISIMDKFVLFCGLVTLHLGIPVKLC